MGASNACITATAIVMWTASNVGVVLLNKHLLSNTGFKQPVFLTLCHMVACCSLSYALSLTKSFPIRHLKSRRQLWKVCLLAVIFCITIVLGNLSLKHIAVSFNQAIGAATPFFTALFALMLQGSRESCATYTTLVPIVVGVVVASGGEPQFHLIGFAACVLATAGRALKTVVQAMLLTDPSEKLDAMSLLFYMSSISVLVLVPSSAALEPGAFAQARGLAAADPGFVWWLALNCFMAYAVNLTNFLVTKYTSALTLQVLGNLKGVIAAGVSVAIFRNVVTAKGMVGYAITIAGVFAYSAAKRRAAASRAVEATKTAQDDTVSATEPLIKACHISSGGFGGGTAVISLVADASCKAGVVSGGGVLPTSTQQLQQLSRAFRSSCGSGGSGGGGVTVVVQVAPEK